LGRPFVYPDHPEWGLTYWDWSLTPLLDGQGEVEFLILSLNEVTESKRAEEALRASEEEYRLLFENAQVGVFQTWIASGKILKANQRLAEMFGYENHYEFLEEFVAPDQYVDPKDREKLLASFQKGEIKDYEISFYRKDGSILWLLISCRINPEKGYLEGVATDITELKAAEEARREGENFLTNIFASIQDGISIVDNNYNIIRVNPAMEKAYPQSLPLVGKKCYQAYHGRSQRCEVCPTRRTLETQEAARELVIERTLEGEIFRCIDLYTFPMMDPASGKLAGVVEYVRDITEQRQIELALLESQEQYRLLVNQIPAVIFKGYADLSVDFFDQKIEVLTGYPKADFDSRRLKWSDLVLPEDLEGIKSTLIESLKTTGSYVWEYRIRKKSGEIAWIQERSQIFCDPEGPIDHTSGVFFDITERKQAEEQIRQSQLRLQAVFDGIPEPLLMVDRDLRFKLLNQAALHYYQADSPETVLDKHCYHVLKGLAAPCAGCEVSAAVSQGEFRVCERQGDRAPDRLEEVFVYPVPNGTGREGAAIIRISDITEARLMERYLLQSEKLASLGLLVAGIAHEINNPNSFITFNIPILRSYLQELLPVVDGYARAHPDFAVCRMPYTEFRQDIFKLVDNLEHGSSRINVTVAALRDFARERGKGEKAQLDLQTVIDRVMSICQGRIRKTAHTFTVEVPAGLPPIFSDPVALEQILVNLLINAAQALDKEDSWIKLQVALGEAREERFIIEVSDNGCGMDAATREKIFDPFFTTKPAGAGTGLGLSIVHRLVEELGGRIEVRSEPGQGTTFRLFFSDKD